MDHLPSRTGNPRETKKWFPMWRSQYGRFLPKDKAAEILDLGCGFGGIVGWFQSQGYARAEGVDINRELIDEGTSASIKNLFHGDAVSFLKGKGEGSYDRIFLIDTLDFLTKDEALEVLRMAASALKKEGKVIIKVSNAESPMAGRLRHRRFWEEVSFTRESLAQLLSKSGFKHVVVFPLRPAVHGFLSFIRFCLWSFIELGLKFYSLVEAGTSAGIFTQNIIAVGEK